MSAVQFARKVDEILRRLDQLEATAHILYGKGTYTPTYVGGTTAGVTAYTNQVGAWVRLGKLAIVVGQVGWSAATGTGEARISLPFAPVTYNASGCIRLSAVTFANSTPLVLAPGSVSYFVLDSPLTNAANTRVAVEAAGDIVFVIVYLV